jgi:hypothetical protein
LTSLRGPTEHELRCALPRAFDCPGSPYGEARALLWVWAWPELVLWPRSVSWLFPQVNEQQSVPGDLWGIDSAGELIIVEAKTRGSRSDPFGDFANAMERNDSKWRDAMHASTLRRRWNHLLEKEEQFINKHADDVRHGRALPGNYPGVIHYSRHRASCQCWPLIYLERIVPRVRSEAYRDEVEHALRLRHDRGDRSAHFIGPIAEVGSRDAALSVRGDRNLRRLLSTASSDQVHLIAVRGTPTEVDVVIKARRLMPLF